MTTIRWIISIVLLLLSLWAIAGNLWITFGALFKKLKKFESLIPLIGGISGMIGVLVLPVPGAWRFSWLPLIVDLGCLPLLVSALPKFISEFWSARRK